MQPDRANATSGPTRRFLWQITAVLVASAVVIFGGAFWRTQALLSAEAVDSARSYVNLIVAARSWNALHGGVWVVKGPGVETNGYLAQMGVSTDATTTDGRVLTLRNPALMTREISEVLGSEHGARFHLTSLKPINPVNAPDEWERGALRRFDQGEPDASTTREESSTLVLRYMEPLRVEQSCLACHAKQGYKVGDIRGAISVTVPLTRQERDAVVNAVLIGATGLLVTALLLTSTFALVRAMRRQLEAAQEALVEAANTDELTRLASRRYTMERLREEIERARRSGRPLALVMADIDHFKSVNDTHGHAMGDAVLRAVSSRMTRALRPYDLLGRIGGEEFLLIAPDTDIDGAVGIAERARVLIAGDPVAVDGVVVEVSASFGVTLIDPNEPAALDRSLDRVDAALYASKAAGRDRVSVIERVQPAVPSQE